MTAPGLTQVPLIKVATPTGGEIEVMGPGEEARYNQGLAAYTTNVEFTERSDLEDLERILYMELMVYRWSRWMMAGREYDGTLVTNEGELRRWVSDFNSLITKTKESLKLDKKGRESDANATFQQRWERLTQHAMDMGIHRETQLGVALEIMQGFNGLVRTYDRSDEEERKVLGFPDEASLVQFWREQMPHFDAVDEYFRTHKQKFWVREP